MCSAGSFAEDWTQSRVLVTGGAGFLGSALVWALNQRGCQNVVIADYPPDDVKRHNLEPLRFEAYLEPEELLAKSAGGFLRSFDYVLHMGACSSTTETDAAYLRRNNYEYTRTLAAEALRAEVRFVYASSAATYGDGSNGMEDASHESLSALKPLNLYGWSKHAFDLEAHRQGWLDRMVGLKYFNVFGPNEAHKGDMRSMVNKSYQQVTHTGVIRLFKSYRAEFPDGEQQRDFLYVKDAVEITLHLATHRAAAGLFNVGSGQARSWNELAHAVFAALHRPAHIEYIDMPAEIRDQYQYYTRANIDKLRAAGYLRPVTPLEEAVEDYVKNYLVPGKTLGQ